MTVGIAIQHQSAHTPEHTKVYQTDNATLCRGNALEILPLIEPESIDALITVTNGAIVIHTQRLKSDPGGNLLS